MPSKSVAVHQGLLQATLQCLRKKVDSQLAEVELLRQPLIWFGRMIADRLGTRPSAETINAITRLSPSMTVENVSVLLGMARYLRKFVPNYSIVGAPNYNLLCNPRFKMKWKNEQGARGRSTKKSSTPYTNSCHYHPLSPSLGGTSPSSCISTLTSERGAEGSAHTRPRLCGKGACLRQSPMVQDRYAKISDRQGTYGSHAGRQQVPVLYLGVAVDPHPRLLAADLTPQKPSTLPQKTPVGVETDGVWYDSQVALGYA